jgi:hypothetical protein
MVDIFYERQQGGLCRKHVLNAYFRRSKYSVSDFDNLCEDYDKYMERCGYISVASSKNFDLIESNQNTVISYALYLEKVYTILVPYTYLQCMLKLKSKSSLQDLIGNDCDFFFIFNEGHIWGCGKNNGLWYNIDSLSGVRLVNINQYDWKKHGFIIPCSNKRTIMELVTNVSDIKAYLHEHNTNFNNSTEIITLLQNLHQSNQLLGDLEILIASVVNILRIITDHSNNTIIGNIINNYQIFLKLFEQKRLDFDNIKTYIPYILQHICNLNLNAFKLN